MPSTSGRTRPLLRARNRGVLLHMVLRSSPSTPRTTTSQSQRSFVMDYSADELRAILAAYQLVASASWPDLNPNMKSNSARWATASAAELKTELDGYLREV